MADVKKIKLPDNSEYNIKDYRIPGVDTVPTSGSGNVITSGGIYAANYAGSDSNGGPALKTYGIPYGAVDSTSTATVITATVDNFPTELTDGVCAYIRNDIISSASGWTLNVNGTGAKPVYASNADATRVTTIFSSSTTYLFVYNSTRVADGCWDIYYGYNANDNTIGYNLRTNAATAPAKSKFYRYRIVFTSPDGQYLIPSNTSSSTNATAIRSVNQDKIDPFGPIWYYSTTTAVEANASAGASYLWLQYTGISLGYSFNRTSTALTLTAKDPVYIKCNPQTDGSAIIDDGTPFVQALPSTEDGKIYIFLGYAESATAITLYYWHPVYYYKDNAIRLWTNAADTTITVDTELDAESDNPVSNSAVTAVILDNERVTAAALNDLNDRLEDTVKHTSQTLTDAQKEQARTNIGAIGQEELDDTEEVIASALNDLNDRILDIDTSSMTSVTWAELVALRDNNQLEPGHQYRITDYVTRVQFEECRSMEHPFDIIVVADSTNELNEDAKAILHEGDSYFNEFQNTDSGIELNFRWSHIEGWELKYCLDNDRDRFYWACDSEYIESYIEQNYGSHIFSRDSSNDSNGLYCWSISSDIPGISISLVYTKVEHPSIGTTVYDVDGETELGEISNYCSGPGKGVIYYMKDDQNNVAEYDFKNVQFLKRFNGFDESSNNYNFDPSGSDQEWFYPLTFHLIDDNNDPVSHYLADASMVSKIYIDEIYSDYNNSGGDCKNNYLGRIDAYNCIVSTETNSYYPATLPYDWFVETSGGVLEENGVDKKVQSWRFMARYNINKGNDWSNYDEWLATSKAIDNRITDRTQYMVEYGPTLYDFNMSGWNMMVFEWIPEFGTSADIYLKTTDSNYAWTLSVSADYLSVSYSALAHWYSYTPTTLGSDGMYYVKLGTLSSTSRYLCVKGTNTNVGSGNANTYCKFHITAPCYVYGNIMSLIGKTSQNDISDNTFNVSYLFNNLFKDEINLFSHPSYRLFMTSTRIPPYSCRNMFDGCKNMTVSPYMSCTDLGNQYCFVEILNNTDNLRCVITGDLTSTVVSRCIADKKYNELYYIIGKNVRGNVKALYTSSNIEYPLVSMIAHLSNHSLFEKIKQQQLHTSSDYSIEPNKMFGFGTITGSITFTLSSKEDDITSNHYYWTFDTGTTVPTITWPTGITWIGGSAPTLNPNKHYEISVLNNIAVWMEV